MTTQKYDLHDCTPSQEQTWLLKAALLSGKEALDAWHRWHSHINLDDIDPMSYRLLPLVYYNLKTYDDDPIMARLKGVFRHTWYKNQILLHQVEQLVSAFQAAEIPVMFLKGAALALQYYPDVGTRFMLDVDIMVPHQDYIRAIDLMFDQRWKLINCSEETLYWYHQHQFEHAFTFHKERSQLDLHYRLLPFVPQTKETYWATASSQEWHGRKVYFLNATDQLFHVCCHGPRWGYAYLTWIADALTILINDTTKIHWDYLVEHSRQTRMIMYMRNALWYLSEEFHADIPDNVLHSLADIQASKAEQMEFKRLGTSQHTIPNIVSYHIVRAMRFNAIGLTMGTPIPLSFTSWIRYFSIKWQLKYWWQWSTRFVKKLRLLQSNMRH